MTEFDGLCSLRLRKPCLWEGDRYDGVVAVQATPVLSGALRVPGVMRGLMCGCCSGALG